MQFRNIRVNGLMCKISSTGKSCTIMITDWSVFDRLKEVLLKKPVGKDEYPDDARIFGVGKNGIYEIYDDDDEVPEDYDENKKDEDDAPF